MSFSSMPRILLTSFPSLPSPPIIDLRLFMSVRVTARVNSIVGIRIRKNMSTPRSRRIQLA